jgi:hypothetical protein
MKKRNSPKRGQTDALVGFIRSEYVGQIFGITKGRPIDALSLSTPTSFFLFSPFLFFFFLFGEDGEMFRYL